ncbi:MAG: DUF4349 domain-containing protein [Acidobacteria bacterium]|nr:DUF4349 domain-containing protein [Acidobacteriota bacterium]
MGLEDEQRAEERRQESRELSQYGDKGVAWEPTSLWRQMSLAGTLAAALEMERPYEGQVSMQAGQVAKLRGELYIRTPNPEDRKIVKEGRLRLIVRDPAESAEKLRAVAQRFGDYVAGMDFEQTEKEQGAGVALRLPVAQFDAARAEIKKLAVRVVGETVEATDVTEEYVDLDSALRNYRAEEEQYLRVLRRADKVKDILEVSKQLADVRGRVEKATGQLRLLSHQVAMSSIRVNLRSESEAELMGLQWRPFYRTRVAFRNGLQSVANYADFALALVMKLPAILLWAATMILALKYGWKLLVKLWGMRGEVPSKV